MKSGIYVAFLTAALAVGTCAAVEAAASQGAARTFAMPSRYYQVGPNPNAIAAADLNDDGLLDIVTADRGQLHDPREERPANDELSVLLSSAPMDYARRHPSLKTGFGPYALALANVDGLKWPDIITVNFHATRHRDVSVFLNLKDEGVFKPLEFRIPDESVSYKRHYDGEGVPLYTTPGLTCALVRDLNGDGLRDLIAAGWSSDVIAVLPGHAEKIFDEPRFIQAAGAPRALALADLDGDNALDLAAVMYATAEVALFKGNGQGGFEERTRFKTRGHLPSALQMIDVNDDGLLDIVVSHVHSDDAIVIFYGDGPFSFAVSQEIMLGTDRNVLEHEIRDIACADLNGSARGDIVAACYASASVAVLINQSGDSHLPQRFQRETYRFSEGKPRALCLGDFDNDKAMDIAVALWETNAVGIMRNVR